MILRDARLGLRRGIVRPPLTSTRRFGEIGSSHFAPPIFYAPNRNGAAGTTFTLATIVFVLLALGAMVVLPIVLNYLGIAAAAELATKILRWPALLLVVMLGVAFLYRYGPSRAKPKWRWVTSGSVFAAIAW